MTTTAALDLLRDLFELVAQIAGPALAASLSVGLAVGVVQTATQVNEASVSFVAKLLAITTALSVSGPFALDKLLTYTKRTLSGSSEVRR